MLPGIGASELIVIAVVALIVVGPKDLPKMLRQLGKFVGKMRSMADEFRASFDDMARQSELDDLRKEVEALRSGQSISPIMDDINHDMKALESDINTSLNSSLAQPVGPSYSDAVDVPSPDETDLAPVSDMPVNPDPNPRRARKAPAVDEPAEDEPAENENATATPKKTRTKKPIQKVISE